MLNSSYTVPCDPNTMRDTGVQRNATYTLKDPAEEKYMALNKQETKTDLVTAIKEEQKVMSAMQARCKHKRPATATRWSQGILKEITGQSTNKVVHMVELTTSIMDHKNKSSSLFSPALRNERPASVVKSVKALSTISNASKKSSGSTARCQKI